MIEYKSGEELSFMKKSPHSPECVSSIGKRTSKNREQMNLLLTFKEQVHFLSCFIWTTCLGIVLRIDGVFQLIK